MHLALGDPQSVPAGKYAKQAPEKLGLWEQLRAKVAAAGDVRGALTYVETGAAEAGIVYATDAAISKKVKVAMTIPLELSGPDSLSARAAQASGGPACRRILLPVPPLTGIAEDFSAVRVHTLCRTPRQGKPGRDRLAEEWTALRLSFQVAVCAALAGLPLAIAVGYWLARGRFGGKWLIEVVANLPAGAAAGGDRISAADPVWRRAGRSARSCKAGSASRSCSPGGPRPWLPWSWVSR